MVLDDMEDLEDGIAIKVSIVSNWIYLFIYIYLFIIFTFWNNTLIVYSESLEEGASGIRIMISITPVTSTLSTGIKLSSIRHCDCDCGDWDWDFGFGEVSIFGFFMPILEVFEFFLLNLFLWVVLLISASSSFCVPF